jgi:iron complex transport system substrate-binding protein
MTKGRAALPWSVVAEQKLFFITLGGPTAHDFFGRDDNFICARKVFNEEFLPPTIELSSRPKESWVVDPPKGMKNVFPATTLAGSAVLPFVISTGAQRSGEICGPADLSWECFSTERSVVEGPAVRRLFPGNVLRRPVTRRGFVTSLISLALTTRLSAQTKPARIVSTAPSITEALFALGLGPQVVGVSRFCDFPPEVQKLPKVGTYIKPDPEAIARLAPDLVILQGNPTELINRLEALRLVFVEVPHGTLNDVFAGMEIIAKAAGYPERAAPLVSRIQAGLDAIQTKAKALPSPRVMIIADRRQGTLTDLISIGPDNYVNEILQIAGGINVLAKPGQPHYPRISLETVLRENPEVLIDLSGNQESEANREAGRSATLALWRQNAELNAVRSGRVYVGTTNALLVPGPRTVEAAQRLFDYLHGGGNQD